ncbi:MAG: succinyl-diaminopimelate desuccinylase [Fulvimarina manganoxydans]|uniref:succinyl-diaminopimelate desuccinylase n=1 Tax=Fulvimarina manganoxydans TaxID=937218 RepID=UPI002357FF8F|nr:succinyl-diaminopimelate desuccinylase [Fulvimarina manganoxydans]MCK5933460.1 succinyl-diaminopimelate desuccinylase [Fulvimarina manganoxydans]
MVFAPDFDPTDPVAVLTELIRCRSVTPNEGGALSALQTMLEPLGFSVDRPTFSDADTPDVENLFAARGAGPHLVFAGHTDVVPPGEEADWQVPPFSADIVDGELYGRGAVDMKGGIAAFIAAVARQIAENRLPEGRVSLLITGDEEGPAVNGTVKLLDWTVREKGERFDACLVGEPTNPDRLGDMIKIGRRGSLSAEVVVHGRQGHVAYPHLADNPLRTILAIGESLLAEPLDEGTEAFPPSNCEITSIDTGNPSVNVVPARARLFLNVRFSDVWSSESLKAELTRRIDAGATGGRYRPGREPAKVEISWRERPAEPFLTRSEPLIEAISEAVKEVTGSTAKLSTTGGTSDARFIRFVCPVVEFGLVGQTMHMTDERVPLADLEALTEIYDQFISRWFAAQP